MSRIGVYPGTFDPITNGHMDIIVRGSRLVDRLIVAVARNDGKGPLFGTDERVQLVRREMQDVDANGIDIERDQAILGPWLEMDPKTERFTSDERANTLLRRTYREPFVVPEQI